MKARILNEGQEGASNGGADWTEVCVNGVHLTISKSWYDQGYKETHWHRTTINGRCNCGRTMELDPEQTALVKKFLRTGERGKIEHETEEVFADRKSPPPPRNPRQG